MALGAAAGILLGLTLGGLCHWNARSAGREAAKRQEARTAQAGSHEHGHRPTDHHRRSGVPRLQPQRRLPGDAALPAEKKDATPPPPDVDPEPSGATLIVRNLAAGRDTTFGNVSEYAWQDLPKQGRLLALAISAEDKTGNGVQLFDPESGSLRVLDSSSSSYTGLAWRKKSTDLAVLKSKADDKHDGPAQIALAWGHLGESKEASEPTTLRDRSFLRACGRSRTGVRHGPTTVPSCSWESASGPKAAERRAMRRRTRTRKSPSVDVWHWKDTDVLPKQKLSAKNDRQRNLLAAWHIEGGQLVQLARGEREQVRPLKNQKLAWAAGLVGICDGPQHRALSGRSLCGRSCHR